MYSTSTLILHLHARKRANIFAALSVDHSLTMDMPQWNVHCRAPPNHLATAANEILIAVAQRFREIMFSMSSCDLEWSIICSPCICESTACIISIPHLMWWSWCTCWGSRLMTLCRVCPSKLQIENTFWRENSSRSSGTKMKVVFVRQITRASRRRRSLCFVKYTCTQRIHQPLISRKKSITIITVILSPMPERCTSANALEGHRYELARGKKDKPNKIRRELRRCWKRKEYEEKINVSPVEIISCYINELQNCGLLWSVTLQSKIFGKWFRHLRCDTTVWPEPCQFQS